MTSPRDNERSIDPGPPGESVELLDLARRLAEERPVPQAGFRAGLRRMLLETAGAQISARRGLRLRILAYAGSGVALLAIATLGVAGVGPLAAG